MTWLQILYVTWLYFILAEVLFPYFNDRARSLIHLVAGAVEWDEPVLSACVMVVYIVWPIWYVVVWRMRRHETLARITRELTQ